MSENRTGGKCACQPSQFMVNQPTIPASSHAAALGLPANALADALGVPVNHVTMILHGQRGVSADTALRLARYFGTTPEMWMNLQKTWELRRAELEAGREIAERVTPRQSVA